MANRSAHFIDGGWLPGSGEGFASTDPATGGTNWEGAVATGAEIDLAVDAAVASSEEWAATADQPRFQLVLEISRQYEARKDRLVEAICRETGKPRWEAAMEVASMVAKVNISIDAFKKRCAEYSVRAAGGQGHARFKPVGVMAVLGPFNFPGHLPNGHLIPAVLAGNAVVFKPSEQTPHVGEVMAEAWAAAIESAGAPRGVFNLVQGGGTTGSLLAGHSRIDGVLFTGSYHVGQTLSRMLADCPEKMLALEMGGNNPLIVWECADLDAAAWAITQSAYLTAGQRCSCARRLIVPAGAPGEAILDRLLATLARVRVGFWTDNPEPFMGTVISATAGDRLLAAQENMLREGARCILSMHPSNRSPALLSPGLIDVTEQHDREDVEHFGPLLQVVRAQDFDAAIQEANRTRFGLAAGLLSDQPQLYQRFYARTRAGVVNWNRPLTGASSELPFGGVGRSGNHRPSAFFAADYCSHPIASLEQARLIPPAEPPVGLDPAG